MAFFLERVCSLYFIYAAILMQVQNNSADLSGVFNRTAMTNWLFMDMQA